MAAAVAVSKCSAAEARSVAVEHEPGDAGVDQLQPAQPLHDVSSTACPVDHEDDLHTVIRRESFGICSREHRWGIHNHHVVLHRGLGQQVRNPGRVCDVAGAGDVPPGRQKVKPMRRRDRLNEVHERSKAGGKLDEARRPRRPEDRVLSWISHIGVDEEDTLTRARGNRGIISRESRLASGRLRARDEQRRYVIRLTA
jgi:hypothetical protein